MSWVSHKRELFVGEPDDGVDAPNLPWGRIFAITQQALENESVADQHMAAALLPADRLRGLPAFKQFKLDGLRARAGVFFRPVFSAATVLLPIYVLVRWAALLRTSLANGSGESVSSGKTAAYFGFLEGHIGQIESVDASSHDETAAPIEKLTLTDVGRELSLVDALRCVRVHAKVLRWLVRDRAEPLTPHVLYAHNALDLIVAGAFVARQPDRVFVTANVLQHRGFVLGHLAQHCWVVQHGTLRTTYEFPHPFASVDRIFLLSESSRADFETYYSAEDYRVLGQTVFFGPNPLGDQCVLLGSSAPFVQTEIEFCRSLLRANGGPIAIKLHPFHAYDGRDTELLALADLVVEANADLQCSVFVSHSSTYALHYERVGVDTISLEHHEIDEVVRQVVERKVSPPTTS